VTAATTALQTTAKATALT